MSFTMVTVLELDSRVWMARGAQLILRVQVFEEPPLGILPSYLKFCISNKISKCGSLRSCGKGRESYGTNTSALFFACVYIGMVTLWSDCNILWLNETLVYSHCLNPNLCQTDRWIQTVSGNSCSSI